MLTFKVLWDDTIVVIVTNRERGEALFKFDFKYLNTENVKFISVRKKRETEREEQRKRDK